MGRFLTPFYDLYFSQYYTQSIIYTIIYTILYISRPAYKSICKLRSEIMTKISDPCISRSKIKLVKNSFKIVLKTNFNINIIAVILCCKLHTPVTGENLVRFYLESNKKWLLLSKKSRMRRSYIIGWDPWINGCM